MYPQAHKAIMYRVLFAKTLFTLLIFPKKITVIKKQTKGKKVGELKISSRDHTLK